MINRETQGGLKCLGHVGLAILKEYHVFFFFSGFFKYSLGSSDISIFLEGLKGVGTAASEKGQWRESKSKI